MKAIRFHKHGGPEVLVYEEVPEPIPGPGELLIRVEAAGVNYSDTMRRWNDPYPEPSPLPFMPGVEVAGTVAALGVGVSGPPVGTPVFAAPGKGGYAQFVVVPAAIAIPIPPGLDPARAAALVLQGLTALLTLKQSARLQPGETVLVQAAAGGVGGLAVQLAKLLGAGKVIGAASSPEKRQVALDLGADVAVDYTTPGWTEEVKRATDGKGVDVVLEMVGGPVLDQSLACLATFGRMVVYGLASRENATVNPQTLLLLNQTIAGFYVGTYFARPDLIQASLGELIGHVLSGRVKLTIGEVLPLAQAAKAHQMLEGRKAKGKIVLLPWADEALPG
jgi:NADPH2:quinone reductase